MTSRSSRVMRTVVWIAVLLSLGVAVPVPTRAQVQVAAPTRSTTMGREILSFGFGTGAGAILPPFVTRVLPYNGEPLPLGDLRVVLKDGQPMLRARGHVGLLVTLPEALPPDFTLEFDIVPKVCCVSPDDITFEGKARIYRGDESAEVMWHQNSLTILGGGGTTFYARMPVDPNDPDRKSAPKLTKLVFEVQGDQMRVFANGVQQLPDIPSKKFWRADKVLRVFLGGDLSDPDAPGHEVYLARMRITAGAPTAVASSPSAVSPSSNPLPNVGRGSQPTATSTSASTGSGNPVPGSGNPAPGTTLVQNVTVTLGPNGPMVNWQQGTAPAVYTVQRWKSDDVNCCNNSSPASPPLTGPPWQDSPPLLSGTYTYLVTATSSSGSAKAGTDFNYTSGTAGRGTAVTQSPPNSRNPGTNTLPTAPARGPGAGAGTPAPGLTVTVTMGPRGPVVTWPAVPRARGYRASRWHVDDANCCNTTSGSSPTATSPWQDQPLPRDGPYLYRVVAETPAGPLVGETRFAYRMPGASANPDPFAPSTPTATGNPTPPTTGAGALGQSPRRGSTTAPNAPAASGFQIRNPTPTTAQFAFDVVPSAVGYRIRRSVSGNGAWTDVTPTPIPPSGDPGIVTLFPNVLDAPLDYRQTYTYELHALQPDGTYGTTTLTHTPPAPADPSGFFAVAAGPGEVYLDWNSVPGVATYRISGPGTGPGGSISAPETVGRSTNQYRLTGVPAGRQSWTIASEYTPGGVLTPANAWPTAAADVRGPDPAPRYRLVALGFQVDQQSTEINDARDGRGDEVYFTAIVNRTTLSRLATPVVKDVNVSFHGTRTHGDEAVSVPYGRIRAGTASAEGGLKTGDVVPATLDLTGPTPPPQTNSFPVILWEGDLENDAVVIVHPALWEDDGNPQVQAMWGVLISNEAGGLYEPQGDQRSNDVYVIDRRTYVTRDVIRDFSGQGAPNTRAQVFGNSIGFGFDNTATRGSTLFQCNIWLVVGVRRPCETHGVDRPIGLRSNGQPGEWWDPVIVLTKAGLLNSSAILPGTFSINLFDDVGTAKTEATAKYRLYFRLERIP